MAALQFCSVFNYNEISLGELCSVVYSIPHYWNRRVHDPTRFASVSFLKRQQWNCLGVKLENWGVVCVESVVLSATHPHCHYTLSSGVTFSDATQCDAERSSSLQAGGHRGSFGFICYCVWANAAARGDNLLKLRDELKLKLVAHHPSAGATFLMMAVYIRGFTWGHWHHPTCSSGCYIICHQEGPSRSVLHQISNDPWSDLYISDSFEHEEVRGVLQ